MNPMHALQWIAVAFVAFLVLCLMAVVVIAVVKEAKKNPIKQSFDTDANVFNSHPEENQDK